MLNRVLRARKTWDPPHDKILHSLSSWDPPRQNPGYGPVFEVKMSYEQVGTTELVDSADTYFMRTCRQNKNIHGHKKFKNAKGRYPFQRTKRQKE